MGKIRVSVEFNCGQGVFSAGGTLQGSVVLSLSEATKITKVTCHVLGWAKVHWTSSGRMPDKGSDQYKAEEIYIDEMFNLFGSGGGKVVMLTPGAHRFPFSTSLDASLPSSYEGTFGHVRYVCGVSVGRPVFRFDVHRTVPFTIVRTLDLNAEPGALHPVQASDGVEYNECCCCSSAQVTADFAIDHRAYVPGQYILINGHVTNHSSSKLPPPQAILTQYVTFYGKRDGFFTSGRMKSKVTSGMVIYHSVGEVKMGQTQVWQNQSIEIPPIPPSGLDGCNIIDINYSLVIQVLPKDGRPINLVFELTVGTIPARQSMYDDSADPAVAVIQGGGGTEGNVSPSHVPLNPTAPPIEGPEGPPPYEDMPPPSYEESVFGRVTIYNDNGNSGGGQGGGGDQTDGETPNHVDFAPVYPVYHTMRPPVGGAGGNQPGITTTQLNSGSAPPNAPITTQPLATQGSVSAEPNAPNGSYSLVCPGGGSSAVDSGGGESSVIAGTSGGLSTEGVILTQPQLSSQVIPSNPEKKVPPGNNPDWL